MLKYAKNMLKYALIMLKYAIYNICENILFARIGQKHIQYQINAEAYFESLC